MTGTWSELYKAGYTLVKRPKWTHGGVLRLWVDEKGVLHSTSLDDKRHVIADDQEHHKHSQKVWVGVEE